MPVKRRRRTPLTATQLREQLVSLCDAITADRALDPEEVEALRTWLRDSAGIDLPQHLRNVVSRVIVTRQLTRDERREVYRTAEATHSPMSALGLSARPVRPLWATAAIFTGLIGLAALVAVLSNQ